MALNIGRVCMKIAGREAGRYCVVLKKLDDTFVLVTGPRVLTGVKRRRCNVEHLEPTQYTVKVSAEASENEVIKAYKVAGLLKKFGLRKPSPEVVKEAEKKVKKKEKKPKEEKKEEKVKEKPKEIKEEKKKPEKEKGIKIKFKIPTLRKAKKPEKKKEKPKKKPEKKKVEKKKPKKEASKKKPKKKK